jgi:HD superfamily phosphohydrolase YqeK
LCAKGLNEKNIHKMFPVYVGKRLSRKAAHNWVEKLYQGRLKVADNARQVAEVAETRVKKLYAAGFHALAK